MRVEYAVRVMIGAWRMMMRGAPSCFDDADNIDCSFCFNERIAGAWLDSVLKSFLSMVCDMEFANNLFFYAMDNRRHSAL